MDTDRRAEGVFHAKLTFLYHTVVRRHDRAVGAGEDAGKASDAFVVIKDDCAVFSGQSAGDAALDTDRVVTVPAGHCKADAVFLFDADTGIDPDVFQRLDHVGNARVGKSAVILTQMAPEAPFLVYIYSFHESSLTL